MHDLFGVSLVHNHFQLNDGEYVETAVKSIDTDVEQLMANYSINGHSFAFHTKASTSSSMDNAVPYMWAYDKTTNAYFPTQFFDGNNNKIVERLTKLCDRTNLIEFLNEYKVELMKYGLENDLGLFLLYQDLVEHNKSAEVSYEVTDVKIREQVLFVSPKGSVQQLMEHYGHNCVRNTHWTIIQNDDGSISKAIGGCICGIDC
ncbi:unnamed protein product [Rotaria sp. Silwood2]|nr:unnamed protein product [Rotaria sp. Silwood2]CAF2866014.1 unnamed protein product [Rotaria sp. Silwood2]CAF2972092.1 unnamed protein product [Rotaria sp. Silwood2]CAF4248588.1 unnamed protein product [Rotaria sp. Silwood2]CAF4440002.1 unnamed protein product [Rotaria sp. Silwood2]